MWRYRIGVFFRDMPDKISEKWNRGLDLLGEPLMALVVFFLTPMTVAFVYVTIKHGLWTMIWVVIPWAIVFLVGFIRSCIKYVEKIEAAKRKVAHFEDREAIAREAMPPSWKAQQHLSQYLNGQSGPMLSPQWPPPWGPQPWTPPPTNPKPGK